MDEHLQNDALMQRVERRRKLKQEPKWKRKLRRSWPMMRLALVCLAVVVLIIGIGKPSIVSGELFRATEPPVTEPSVTEPPATDPPTTEPPATEPPTEEPTIPGVGGVIYLTFDDGPGAATPRLLDILDKYNAKATFFVVDTPFVSTITQIAASGHALAMHTATHDFQKVYSSIEGYFDDLEKIESIIEEYAGYRPAIIRFPGGSSNRVSKKYCDSIMTDLARIVEEKGYVYFDWDVDSCDASDAKTAEAVYRNVVRGCSTRTSSIVLMHDIRSYTVDAIEDILIWGQANGYVFEALTTNTPVVHHTIQN